MYCQSVLVCLFFAYNAKGQLLGDYGFLPSNLPLTLKKLLSQSNAPSTIPITKLPGTAPTCGRIPSSINSKKCGCPEPNCGCYGFAQAPIVPPFGYNPAIGLPNPVIGVQSCGCTNSFGACTCGTPVVGNLCGRCSPAVGLATSCGCSDPSVRIIDGCPDCQPIYSYNLPSLGLPTCGCTSIGFPTCGYGATGMPSYLPSIGLPCGCEPGSCGCNTFTKSGLRGPCGRPINQCTCTCKGCGRPVKSCTCGGCECGVNSCGCVEVPCGPPRVKTTCNCVTPTIETPCGCVQGPLTCACTTMLEVPTYELPVLPPFAPVTGCTKYLRQVCVQPPFL